MKAIIKFITLIGDKHGKFKVMGFRNEKENQFIFDSILIKQEFLSKGEMFEPNYSRSYSSYLKHKYLVVDCEINPKSPNGENGNDKYKIKPNSRPTPLKYFVVEVDKLLLNEHFIDFEHLQSFGETPSKFYAKCNRKYYGAFKVSDHGVIIANTGKEVDVYNELPTFTDESIRIVYDKPSNSIGTVAAESDDDIAKWFKSITDELDHPIILSLRENQNWRNELEKLIIPKTDRDKTRLKLAFGDIENIDFTVQAFKKLLENLEMQDLLKQKLDQLSGEIKEELRPKIETKILQKSEEIKELTTQKERLYSEIQKLQSKINQQKKEHNESLAKQKEELDSLTTIIEEKKLDLSHLEGNFDQIVKDIRLKSMIHGGNTANEDKKALLNSHIINYINYTYMGGAPFVTPPDISTFLEEEMRSIGIDNFNKDLFRSSLSTIFRSKALLSDSLPVVNCFLKAIGRCKIRYISVQVNWIDHSFIEQCEISSFMTKATEDPENHYFFILQDFNISSPECYLRQVLDFQLGIIPTLYGESMIWPPNFHVIGIVLPLEVGLPLHRKTLYSWAALPMFEIESLSPNPYSAPASYISDEIISSLIDMHNESNLDEYVDVN